MNALLTILCLATDCPQRDERIGWTGDAQLYVRAATFNSDIASFYTKWLRDLNDDAWDYGAIPPTLLAPLPDPMNITPPSPHMVITTLQASSSNNANTRVGDTKSSSERLPFGNVGTPTSKTKDRNRLP